MAILTSTPDKDNKVKIYDVPDSDLQKFEVSGADAGKMFPQREKPAGGIAKSEGAMGVMKIDNADALGEVQAYSDVCVCRELLCDGYGNCWWHYYYCYCY
jgi:hypothetical protein